MSTLSEKSGFNAGREGNKPNPPTWGPVARMLTGVDDKREAELQQDYKNAYQAGATQRVADELKKSREGK